MFDNEGSLALAINKHSGFVFFDERADNFFAIVRDIISGCVETFGCESIWTHGEIFFLLLEVVLIVSNFTR